MFMKPESPDSQLIALIDRVALADELALKELYDLSSSKLYGVALREPCSSCQSRQAS